MDATLPETIGSFRIVSKLGQGGMGAVYHAVHGTLERPCALKILPAEFSNNPEYVTRFLREARTVAALSHDNVVKVYDAGEQNGQYFIAMELVDGVNLQKFVDDKPRITEEEGLALLLQAAKGLAAAHSKGLVHRDIKPENMLLGKDSVLRLVDFGLVMESTSTTQLTATGACLGTPMYMSPEQADGEQADVRTDLYSLGVTFYRVFTGQPPFSSPTVMNLLFKHKFEAPPDPKVVRPDLSQNVRNLLLHLMAKRREDRPTNAQAVVDMIEGIKQGKPVPPPPVFVPPVSGATQVTAMHTAAVPAPTASNKTALIAAAAVVALAIIGGGVYLLSGNKNGSAAAAPTIETVNYKVKGDDAFKAGQFKDALDNYQKALAENPSPELDAKINQTRKALDFERIMESADALEQKGELEAAASRYTEAMAIDPGTQAKERLERVKVALAQNKNLNNKEKNAERDAFSKKAAEAEKAGKYDLAAEQYSRAASLSDAQLRVVFADKASECRRQDYLAKAVAAEELKNLLEAEVWYKKALDMKPNDALVAQQLEALQKKLKPATAPVWDVDGAFDTAMREGQRAMDAADYSRARAQFAAALALKAGNAQAADKAREAEGRELLVRGDAFRNAGNAKSAETAYTEAIQKCPALAVEAAARIKALGAANPPPAAAIAPIITKIDGLVRALRDAEAMSEAVAALRANPGSRDLKDAKTALEGLQACAAIYAELDKIGDSAVSRTRDYRDIDDDDRGRDLKDTFEKLNTRNEERAKKIRPLFLEHNYQAVQTALVTARRDALELGDELSSASDLCERKADKAGEKSTGAKAFGITFGVGGDKKKAQKYRDVGESFRKLAEQAKAQGK